MKFNAVVLAASSALVPAFVSALPLAGGQVSVPGLCNLEKQPGAEFLLQFTKGNDIATLDDNGQFFVGDAGVKIRISAVNGVAFNLVDSASNLLTVINDGTFRGDFLKPLAGQQSSFQEIRPKCDCPDEGGAQNCLLFNKASQKCAIGPLDGQLFFGDCQSDDVVGFRFTQAF